MQQLRNIGKIQRKILRPLFRSCLWIQRKINGFSVELLKKNIQMFCIVLSQLCMMTKNTAMWRLLILYCKKMIYRQEMNRLIQRKDN